MLRGPVVAGPTTRAGQRTARYRLDHAAVHAGLALLVGACLQVVGEMMLGSGGWEISFGLAPPGKHGQYQGFFGTGVAVARMLGPLLLTRTLTVNGNRR